jgi:hypothetical protein
MFLGTRAEFTYLAPVRWTRAVDDAFKPWLIKRPEFSPAIRQASARCKRGKDVIPLLPLIATGRCRVQSYYEACACGSHQETHPNPFYPSSPVLSNGSSSSSYSSTRAAFLLIGTVRTTPSSPHAFSNDALPPVRVFRPAIYARIFHGFRNLIETPAQRVARLTRISPVSVDPFKSETVFRTRATPDVCDFNMHLSNSSYAMVRDTTTL